MYVHFILTNWDRRLSPIITSSNLVNEVGDVINDLKKWGITTLDEAAAMAVASVVSHSAPGSVGVQHLTRAERKMIRRQPEAFSHVGEGLVIIDVDDDFSYSTHGGEEHAKALAAQSDEHDDEETDELDEAA